MITLNERQKIPHRRRIVIFTLLITISIFFCSTFVFADETVTILQKLKSYNITSISNPFLDCFRTIGFGIIKFFGNISDSLFKGLQSVFDALTFSYSKEIIAITNKYSILYKALMIISVTGLGIYLLVGKKGKDLNTFTCILLMVLIVSAMPLMMQKMSKLTLASTDVAISTWSTSANATTVKSIAGDVIKDNIVDLRKIDENLKGTSLPKALKKEKGYNSFNVNTWKAIDINDKMDYDDTDYTLKHPELWKYKLVPNSDTNDSYTTEKIKGWTKVTSNYYYRYQVVSWFGMLIKLGSMVFLLFMMIIRAARITIDLALSMIYTPFVAITDLTTGQRIKEVVKDIIAHFAALFLIAAFIGIYFVGFTWINNTNMSMMPKLAMHLALMWAIIDGPSIIERISGVDVGFSSVWKTVSTVAHSAYMVGRAGNIASSAAKVAKKGTSATAKGVSKAGKGASAAGQGLASFVFGKKPTQDGLDKIKNKTSKTMSNIQTKASNAVNNVTGGKGAVGATKNILNKHKATKDNLNNKPNSTSPYTEKPSSSKPVNNVKNSSPYNSNINRDNNPNPKDRR